MIFENDASIPSLDEISRELVQGLPVELSDPYTPNTPWTKAVKATLHDIGKRRGMFVCCHGAKDQGEWLLDVIWMRPEEHPTRIVLAVESEWGNPKAVQDDFEKLLSIKSQRKLLLFSTSNHKGADEFIEVIRKEMESYPYHLDAEEYMALEVTAPGAFRYYFRVPSDGRIDGIRFCELEHLSWLWEQPRHPAVAQ